MSSGSSNCLCQSPRVIAITDFSGVFCRARTVLITGTQRECARPRGALELHGEDGKGDGAMGRRVSTGELGSHGDGVHWTECGLGRCPRTV